jgi:hypothetical protein
MLKYITLILVMTTMIFGANQKPTNPTALSVTIPQMLNYQGKLTNVSGSAVRDSIYTVTFKLYTVAIGGTSFWTETQSLQTQQGLYNVLLGSVTAIPSLPSSGECYLEMQISPNPPMTPRIKLVSSAYAFLAQKADTANYVVSGGGLNGSGTNGRSARWTGTTTLGNSAIYDDGANSIAVGNISNSNCRIMAYGGKKFGIFGQGDSNGITGYSMTSDGYGVYGLADGDYGVGVTGANTTSGGVGVLGRSFGRAGIGVLGVGNNMSDVYAPAFGPGGVFNGESTGIYARAIVASNHVRGGYFVLTDGSNFYYASVACAASGYFYNILGNGSDGVIKQTRDGEKVLFTPQMPEAYSEDVGRGQLNNGHVRINLEPLFSDCISISDQYPLNVFIQMNDDCQGVYTKTDNSGFNVYELNKGTSNAHFTYRIIAKTKGYEPLRLPNKPQDLQVEAKQISHSR